MDGIKSIKSFKFPTDDGHILYVEESGDPNGIPTLFLHGGPGAGIGQNYHWPFASNEYRLIAFDQRGCGRSQPFANLENNNMAAQTADIEALRKFFNIDKWLIFGGSWGSTLALAYAIAHPQCVSGLILRGIFLGRQEDANWFISGSQGASQVFHKEYAEFNPEYCGASTNVDDESIALCQSYFSQLTHTDESVRNCAATRWFKWEDSISKLRKLKVSALEYASNQQIYSLALLECYYLLNACFMPANYILEQAHRLHDIPMHIVHGRYDMVCKCEAAIKLHQALPHSHLNIIEDAGHSMTEPGISAALVDALASMNTLLTKRA